MAFPCHDTCMSIACTDLLKSRALHDMLVAPSAALATMQVSEEELDKAHTAFYLAVERLFLKHQPSFPGYEKVELVMYR